MNIYFHPIELDYTGDQLRSLFTYELSGKPGNNIIAFIGKMNLKEKMIDMEDILENDYIYSPLALNFIVEIFHINLETTILYQRLLMQCITDVLKTYPIFWNNVIREGDDIFYIEEGGKYKMSVSIATVSPISGLIHVGINMKVDDKIPVKAYGIGTDDFFIKDFVKTLFNSFIEEYTGIQCASVKVKTTR